MHGVVALLNEVFSQKVYVLWDGLEDEFGLNAIRLTPIPHFSFHIAESYQKDVFNKEVLEFTKQNSPFHATTSGIAVFDVEQPVIYIKVDLNIELKELHKKLWDKTSKYGVGLSMYYHPDQWTPHITLANKDVQKKSVPGILDFLESFDTVWEMEIDAFGIIYQEEDQIGQIDQSYSLRR